MSVNRISRSSGVVVALGALAISVGGLGIADAASGTGLLLGHHNSATKTTTLTDTKGTPLSLSAKKGKAPLTVNSSTEVKHLNAATVDGSSASSLKTSGSSASTKYTTTTSSNVGTVPVAVASTAALTTAGTYFVSASAAVVLPGEDTGFAACTLSATPVTTAVNVQPESQVDAPSIYPAGDVTSDASLAETAAVPAKAGQKIAEYCWIQSDAIGDGLLKYAGITAVHVDSATTGKVPATQPSKLRHSHTKR